MNTRLNVFDIIVVVATIISIFLASYSTLIEKKIHIINTEEIKGEMLLDIN